MREGLIFASVLLMGVFRAGAQEKVPIWTRFEASFQSSRDYGNQLQQVELRVAFTAPSGKRRTVLGFWDGGRTWRVRFSPDELGLWRWETSAKPASDKELEGKKGSFRCVPYRGDNPLYRHGAIRLSPDRRYLVHADGTPFFWLADTAWNGALRSTDQEWRRYLAERRAKRFTAVQFVCTQWRAAYTDRDGRVAFTGKERIAVNPAFFRRLDRKFDLVNEAGLVALPVLLWAIRGDINPGWSLPEDQAILLVRYMVARYGAHRAIWILAGDGRYEGPNAARWHKIGREGLRFNPGRLATMHPCGRSWPWDDFRDQQWLDILTYQSGHGDGPGTLRWTCTGPPSRKWREKPVRPIINAEPNYEGHRAYESKKPHSAYHVRRAAYWSILATPPAGLTYGAHGIWSWEEKPAVPLNHAGSGIAPPWFEAVKLPGSAQMKIMRDLLDRLPWWRLRPADEIVLDRKDDKTYRTYIKAARTPSGDWAVLYLPANDGVTVNLARLARPAVAEWFDPRTGTFSKPLDIGAGESRRRFSVPGPGDWVLLIHKR